MVFHKFKCFKIQADEGKYAVTHINISLAKGNRVREIALMDGDKEAVRLALQSLATQSQGGKVFIRDKDGSVNNIAQALFILKSKNLISPELLKMICNGFPNYDNSCRFDARVKEAVETKEVATIRQAARWLFLLNIEKNPCDKLPREVCLQIAACADDRKLLSEARAFSVAKTFFKRPEKLDFVVMNPNELPANDIDRAEEVKIFGALRMAPCIL